MSRHMSTLSVLMAFLLAVSLGVASAETVDESELRSAAGRGNSGEVARLLAEGTDPNVPDHTGRTALHHAGENAQARILNMLLEAGGDPDVQDRDGSTPLHLAALFPYFELDSQVSVRTLLSHRADPDLADRDGRTPLHLVAGNHQQATSIRDLVSSGADVNAADRRGDTPLHYAVGRLSKLSADVVAALVSGGADGNVRGGSGETPLQLFVRDGSNDGRIVDALVDAGADVDAKNPEGESPLHTAIRNGGSSENNRVVEALLAAGADPCIKDVSGYIPYNTAREDGEVHTMLANAGGSDIGCQDAEVPMADYVVDPADWPGELTTRANIRSGPGTDHDVVNTLAGGTPVHVTGTVRNTGWLRADVAGETAFVHASLVEEFAPQDEAGQDLAERTEEASHMKTESWKQPICVNEDGDMVHIQLYDLYPALEVGTCVGAVEVVKTTTCDTRTSACVWPCPQGDQECYAEWTSEPEWPYEDYEDDARAVAATARRDAASTRDQGLAAVLAFHEFLRRLTQGEATDGEDTTAAIEAEDTAQEDASGVDATVASIDTEPKCRDWNDDMPVDTVCWWEFTQPSGCFFRGLAHQYTFHDDEVSYRRETTWSGACEAGVATGEGTFTHTIVENIYGHPEFKGPQVIELMSGHYVDGVKQGGWIDQHYPDDASAKIFEGPYVDGQPHGRWIEHSGVNNEYANNQCTSEGLMVQGKREGEWVKRCNNGHCDVGEYADGEQIDYWWC